MRLSSGHTLKTIRLKDPQTCPLAIFRNRLLHDYRSYLPWLVSCSITTVVTVAAVVYRTSVSSIFCPHIWFHSANCIAAESNTLLPPKTRSLIWLSACVIRQSEKTRLNKYTAAVACDLSIHTKNGRGAYAAFGEYKFV